MSKWADELSWADADADNEQMSWWADAYADADADDEQMSRWPNE